MRDVFNSLLCAPGSNIGRSNGSTGYGLSSSPNSNKNSNGTKAVSTLMLFLNCTTFETSKMSNVCMT